MTMIAEIGTLVAIVKGLTDLAKGSSSLFGNQNKETAEAIAKLKGRVAGLAAQLRETVVLLKNIPFWLGDCDPIRSASANAPDDELLRHHAALTRLIALSRYDSFSDTFYRTGFDELPGLGKLMESFRDLLERLEEQLKQVRPAGDLVAIRAEWPLLMLRLDDLRDQAEGLRREANALHGKLIVELEQAGA